MHNNDYCQAPNLSWGVCLKRDEQWLPPGHRTCRGVCVWSVTNSDGRQGTVLVVGCVSEAWLTVTAARAPNLSWGVCLKRDEQCDCRQGTELVVGVSEAWRMGQIKRGQLLFLLVTIERIYKITWFFERIIYSTYKATNDTMPILLS